MRIKAIAKICKAQKTVVTAVDEFGRKWLEHGAGYTLSKGSSGSDIMS